MDGIKECSFCGDTKVLDKFYRDNTTNDGYRAECKDCFELKRMGRGIPSAESPRYRIGNDKFYTLLLLQENKCACCGTTMTNLFAEGDKNALTAVNVDHIVPTSKGGKNDKLENLQLLCKSCNSNKFDKDYEEFLKEKNQSSKTVEVILEPKHKPYVKYLVYQFICLVFLSKIYSIG